MTTNIEYVITPSKPNAHLFSIQCTIREPDPNGQIVWLPAWIPGSYMIRDFAKNIVTVCATSANRQLKVSKLDKQTWQCEACAGPLQIEYTVYAWDLSVRSAHLDTTHAFFNGSSVFLAVKGREDSPVEVQINLPSGNEYQQWRVATTLTRKPGTTLFAAGRFLASNYEELIDHPVEMGTFTDAEFTVAGIPHHIVITGKHNADMSRMAQDVQKICQTHVDMFGGLPEMQRYVFMLTVLDNGYGGLEHRSSTALICSRTDLPTSEMQKPSEKYMTLLGLFSHEYFHTWNIKQIKPEVFIPYQLQQESYTTLLWAFEGITSYYDDLGLIRSGVINENEYFEILGKNITRVLRTGGRFKQSLTESSFEAWTKFYKQDENAPNAIVSYYAKGALFAMCLDLEIRKRSNGTCSLDHVMQHLWREFGQKNIGLRDETIPDVIRSTTSIDLDDFFTQYLSTTIDLPLADLLSYMGVKLKLRPSASLDDAGGTPPKTNDTVKYFNLGAKFIQDNLGARVQFVYDDGCIQNAGISAGDIIVAINNLKANKDNIYTLLQAFNANDTVLCHVFRRDELMAFHITLGNAVEDACYFDIDDQVEKSGLRHAWLKTSTNTIH